MISPRTAAIVLASVSAVMSGAEGCTQDFDKFERSGSGSEPDAAETDAVSPSPGADGSTTPGPTKTDAGPDACGVASSCAASMTTCKAGCEATKTSCDNGCSNNKCRRDCEDARDACVSKCAATCNSCAAGCTGACEM